MRSKAAMKRVLPVLLAGSLMMGGMPPASAATVESGDLDLLQQRLEPLGWRIARNADGDLILQPPAASAPAASGQPQPDRDGGGRLDALERALRERGWRVVRDHDGDLLLYPTEKRKEDGQPDRQQEATATVSAAGDATMDLTDLDAVTEAVERAGWRTERRDDGSLILYPADAMKAKSALPSGVVLPVDSAAEASRIARAWVALQRDGLSVGRIRKIHWIYLVSIVTSEPPYRLQNQLAIRTRDGRVIPLH